MINEVALRRAWLVPGRVTVLGRVNHLSAGLLSLAIPLWEGAMITSVS